MTYFESFESVKNTFELDNEKFFFIIEHIIRNITSFNIENIIRNII